MRMEESYLHPMVFTFLYMITPYVMISLPLLASAVRSLVLAFTCVLDLLIYGSLVIVPLNRLKFKFLSSGGCYYFTELTQGFPVMLFTFTLFSIAEIMKSKNQKLYGS